MDTKSTVSVDKWIHGELVKMGYGDLETHLNEWDPFASEFGTAHHAAEMAAMMISMQYGYPALCCIYDLRIANAPYCPLFNPITFKPVQGWYTFAAFNTLYKLGTQVEAVSDTEDLYALAAVGEKGGALLVSNLTGKAQELTIEGVDLSRARIHVIDNERLLSWTPALGTVQNNEVYLIEW
ncbi:MAG: hypothetical protein J6S44_01230 [Clostridia bacterium]|nr:hypothetical protein [Clostridia bacterium]